MKLSVLKSNSAFLYLASFFFQVPFTFWFLFSQKELG